MATANNLMRLAFKDAGVLGLGQNLQPEDYADGLDTLNQMIAQWRRKRWLVYHLVDLSVVSTGAQTYTVGPAGSSIVYDPRPDRLEAAYVRQIVNQTPNQADYTLRILEAREDYASIVMKAIGNFPYCIFYDTAIPQGILYPYPVPQASIYEVHVLVKALLPRVTVGGAVINLPEEYEAAIRYNLAVRFAAGYGREVSSTIQGLAKESLSVIRGANMQIKRLTMPSELLRPSVYNPYSDQVQ